jgi:hypothetical protein
MLGVRAQESTMITEEIRQDMWNQMHQAGFLSKKGSKVALCRWFAWVDSMQDCFAMANLCIASPTKSATGSMHFV